MNNTALTPHIIEYIKCFEPQVPIHVLFVSFVTRSRHNLNHNSQLFPRNSHGIIKSREAKLNSWPVLNTNSHKIWTLLSDLHEDVT